MNIIKRILFVIAVMSLTMWFLSASAEMPPEAAGKALPSLSAMLTKVMPAVVNITVIVEVPLSAITPYTNNPNDDANAPPSPPADGYGLPKNPTYQDVGSGVIVDAQKGYVVTNAHVVTDAKIITVTLLDGRRFKAKLIGTDKLSDVAVLQIRPDKLTAIPFANSDNLQVGDFVAAIGNPFGLRQTVTSGVISALHRSLGIEGYENFIQTDAPINPGNSGGALLNLQGQLIGINTALIGPVAGNVGIGFAIPSNMVRGVMDQLINYGKVQRGMLGVMVQDLTPALADALNLNGVQGALVTNTTPNSPAAKAGIQAQDVIIKINNTAIDSAGQLKNIVGLSRIGTKLELAVRRGNKTLNLSATIVDPKRLKMAMQPGLASFLDGVRLSDYDQLVPDLGPIKGVGVLDVDQTSEAWLDGLRPGDVILEANNKAVTSIEELLNAIGDNQQRLLLKIGRSSGIIYLVINT